jgi:RIO-like serine/threonine protein kinase
LKQFELVLFNVYFIIKKQLFAMQSMEKANEIRKARFIRKNSQPHCYYLIYKPILDGTFEDINTEIRNDENKLLDFIIQIVNLINIFRKQGFIHTDINHTNFMYKKDRDEKYIWYIIDYGNITNIEYPDSLLDIERINRNPNYKKIQI